MDQYLQGLETLQNASWTKNNEVSSSMLHTATISKGCDLRYAIESCTKALCFAEPGTELVREPNRPYLADALKLENSERFGRHFIANVDIEKNQVISMEESFGHVIDINYTEPMCNNCMAQSKNFIPCPDCVDGVFCNDKCMQQGVI